MYIRLGMLRTSFETRWPLHNRIGTSQIDAARQGKERTSFAYEYWAKFKFIDRSQVCCCCCFKSNFLSGKQQCNSASKWISALGSNSLASCGISVHQHQQSIKRLRLLAALVGRHHSRASESKSLERFQQIVAFYDGTIFSFYFHFIS